MTWFYNLGFVVIDMDGIVIDADEGGLLLFGGGTVCDDGFSYKSANTICRELGYGAAAQWRSGVNWGSIQTSKPINLGNVFCTNDGRWASCRSSTTRDCIHNEDVFLECQGIIFIAFNALFLLDSLILIQDKVKYMCDITVRFHN